MSILKEFHVDKMIVKVYENRTEMGVAAALDLAAKIKTVLAEKDTVNIIFASAPSQADFIEALLTISDIDWSRVVAFHMDEYITLPADSPQRFGPWLKTRLYDKVNPGTVYYVSDGGEKTEQICQRYTKLLRQNPIDITCLGIGENGHLAFNDPADADFKDPQLVKVVELDGKCRQQQVNDGAFSAIDLVPTTAITLTVPALLGARWVMGIVPGIRKSQAIYRMITGPVAEACPASIMQQHDGALLFVDQDAASLLSLK